jgi:hypothetical protein
LSDTPWSPGAELRPAIFSFTLPSAPPPVHSGALSGGTQPPETACGVHQLPDMTIIDSNLRVFS